MSDTAFSDIAISSDRRLRAIEDRVLSTIRLAAFRAIAHSKDPKQFTMPSDAGALEHIVLRRLGSLSPAKQRQAVEKASAIVAAPEATIARTFKGFTQVDFRSARSAAEQLHALAVPKAAQVSQDEVAGLLAALHSEPTAAEKQEPAVAEKSGPPQNHNFLDVRLRKVTCFHEMHKPWEKLVEPADRIAVGGVTIDAWNEVGQIQEIPLGDFDLPHTSVKAFSPPRVLATFDLRQGQTWPRLYTAAIVLVEKDSGGFGAFLNAVLSKAKDLLVGETGKALQGKVSSDVEKILKGLLNMVVGAILGFFVALFNDDVFPPVTETAKVGSLHGTMANGTLVSNERVRRVGVYGADYEVRYDWVFRA